MKAISKCLICHVNQAQRILDKFVISEHEKWNILKKVLNDLSQLNYNLKPIDIAEVMYEKLENYLNKSDLYSEEKKKSNDAALSLYKDFKSRILDSSDPLYEAAKLSVAGNLIDFGAKKGSTEELFKQVIDIWNQPFSIDDFEEFKKSLFSSKNLLFIADNAGDLVFDMLFIEIIKETLHDIEIFVALKGKPIINDATVDDGKYIGIEKFATIIDTKLKTAGASLPKSSEEFRRLFYDSDIIIAKGQGNFEGLSEESRNNLFFALVSKCEVISDFIGVEKNSKLFMNSKRIRQE
ncbi:hypothetical protein Ob7_06113 [Thermosipho africanus Ob7]|uniref:damage-control phosphatase ARMT1 family protein n=1 Tax=Thermosipho africanus TaxID=2421 RepID=UPI000E0BC6CC|nr:ARMT1-like domain-containing protein [Thermosipho africanus]RDI91020.1 hypothetical protein Ob7_06113 [Thermosipho africanus Ob7]